MRVAIVTESFAPDVNGVAGSVLRIAEHLRARGHQPLVVAPQPATSRAAVTGALPYPVVRLPSVPAPRYHSFRLGIPTATLRDALAAHGTEVVHLASPVVLGARAATVAAQLGMPCVAVYQTDVPAYLRAYRVRWAEPVAWRWLRHVHRRVDRTLAPSRPAMAALAAHGIERVWLWGRGVDTERFAPGRRCARLRAQLAPEGELIVGYVGRLATEKRVDLLAEASRLPGVRVVVTGDGPAGPSLRRRLPRAVFFGERRGEQLGRLFASLDLFVHTGPYETFGQTVQEAMASGVPVVAPAAGGPMDLVEPGRTGELVPPGDAAAIARAVAAFAADRERLRRYAVAARQRMVGRSWAAVGDELIDHYRSVRRAVEPAVSRIARETV